MPVTIHCQQCGKPFNVKPGEVGKRKYCSFACRGMAKRGERTEYVEHPCETCGKPVRVTKHRWDKGEGRYCNRACAYGRKKKQVELICETCGNSFVVYESGIKEYDGYKRKYCSNECRNVALRGTERAERIETNCLNCGKSIRLKKADYDRGEGRYCSRECYDKRGPTSEHLRIKCICQSCGKEYETYPSHVKDGRRFCSKECAYAGRTMPERIEKVNIQCPVCDKPMRVPRADLEDGQQRFCSRECANIGKHYNPKTSERFIVYCRHCGREILATQWEIDHGVKRFCSRSCNSAHQMRNFALECPTSIERLLTDELDWRNIDYQFQYPFDQLTMDFAFPDVRLCVEADGMYWHNRPQQKHKDLKRDLFLWSRGWLVLRLTEDEINASPQQCVDRIERALFELRYSDEH